MGQRSKIGTWRDHKPELYPPRADDAPARHTRYNNMTSNFGRKRSRRKNKLWDWISELIELYAGNSVDENDD